MNDNSIIIIGAGFAGLAAGIYGQMNGYNTQIFEMHTLPGGLCTAWKRKGYTIDGCIHWLVGSSPQSSMYRFWEEVGVAQEREFVYAEEYERYEGADGRTVIFYTDADRLEKHLLELSPQDADASRQFTNGIRMCVRFMQLTSPKTPLQNLMSKVKIPAFMVTQGREFQRLMKLTAAEYVKNFKDELLRNAFLDIWFRECPIFFMCFTFAYLHQKDAGYPIGGSLPMSLAMEKRYLSLGGAIHYDSRVEKILVEDDKAVGIRLADGSEHRAGRVISAADGYATIFKMLDGKYADEKIRQPYEKWPLFPSLLYVGLGVNRSFADEPHTVSGMSFPLRQPTEIADAVRDRLPVHIFNQDPTLAPAGKTSLVVMMPSNYEYWKQLAQDKAAYDEKKDQVARTIVTLLEQRFPGIGSQVEMVDVATPLTFERFTGNWKGTFEGWMLTPENSSTLTTPANPRLPGLQNFYMSGQWIQPGGGLPTGVMLSRTLLQTLCKEDHKKFQAIVA